MPSSDVVIRGAREHNLRDVDVVLPRNQLICLTGVSGSGKSSLAFDTVYAEGQRRYVESLSSYARHFLGQMPKPDVDNISGLSPSISISQKSSGTNPRSTVGTITEIYDFLRVLYARVGQGFCTQCGRPITAQIPRTDPGQHPDAAGEHGLRGPGAAGASAEGRVPRPVRGPAQAGVCARPGGRAPRAVERPAAAGPADAPRYRGGRRSVSDQAWRAHSAGRGRRTGVEPGPGHAAGHHPGRSASGHRS